MFEKPTTRSLDELLDKHAVKELIEYERFCRDQCLWAEMHRCFAPEATVTVSWYQGSAHGFVEASRVMTTKAPHKLNNTLVWLYGEKAVSVTMASIQSRKTLDGVEYDMTSYVRFLYTVEKQNSQWQIASMNCIYEKDCLVAVAPSGITSEQTCRESYANLSCILGMSGCTIADDLPGDDRPELIAALEKQVGLWLDAP